MGSAATAALSIVAGSVFDLTDEVKGKNRAERPNGNKIPLEEDFRELFSKTLNSIANGKKIVIFVDDLDRLPPKRAVQIMETMKLFFEVENCVFILAIDFDVVQEGAHAIYGESIDQDKAKQFFDKIIQVPFNVPSPGPEISGLIKELLRGIYEEGNLKKLDKFADLSKQLLSANPRSIKRVANSLMLLKLIVHHSRNEQDATLKVFQNEDRFLFLFWLLCMQVTDFQIANEITADLVKKKPPYLELALRDDIGGGEEDGEEDQDGKNKGAPQNAEDGTSAKEDNPWLRRIGNTAINPLKMLQSFGLEEQKPKTVDEWHHLLSGVAQLARLTAIETEGKVKSLTRGIGFDQIVPVLNDRFNATEGNQLTSNAERQIELFKTKLTEIENFDDYFLVESGARKIRVRINEKYAREVSLRGDGVFYLRYPHTGKFWVNFNYPDLSRSDYLQGDIPVDPMDFEEKVVNAVGLDIVNKLPKREIAEIVAEATGNQSERDDSGKSENQQHIHAEVITNDAFTSDFRLVHSFAAASEEAAAATEFMKAYLEFIIKKLKAAPSKPTPSRPSTD